MNTGFGSHGAESEFAKPTHAEATPDIPADDDGDRRRRGTILITAMWIIIVLGGAAAGLRPLDAGRGDRLRQPTRGAAGGGDRAGGRAVRPVPRRAGAGATSRRSATSRPSRCRSATRTCPGTSGSCRPDPDDDQYYDFGLVDEASKVSLNAASVDELMKLPNMTVDVAAAIVDWRDEDDDVTDQGAESDYYQSLPEPYKAKNAPFETIEETLLVRGVTLDLLYGYDRNRNGVIDDVERIGQRRLDDVQQRRERRRAASSRW